VWLQLWAVVYFSSWFFGNNKLKACKQKGGIKKMPPLTNYKPNASSAIGHRAISYDSAIKKD
jgi:hypothetical protein